MRTRQVKRTGKKGEGFCEIYHCGLREMNVATTQVSHTKYGRTQGNYAKLNRKTTLISLLAASGDLGTANSELI